MPEYQFNVACVDRNACDMVMQDMQKRYGQPTERIIPSRETDGSGDHFIKLQCSNIDDADRKSREMLDQYVNSIYSITVKPL